MAFLLDEAYLPATLSAPPMTDDEFMELCAEHEDLSFEMTAEGDLVVMLPPPALTGIRNQEIAMQFSNWCVADRRGFSLDSSTGYVLPNGARRSPDLSWLPRGEVKKLSREERQSLPHLCPGFLIELRSPSQSLRTLREKMREWIENGARLAWLIDPENRTVEIYRPDREPEILTGLDSIAGEEPIDGFVLDLRPVWDPLDDELRAEE